MHILLVLNFFLMLLSPGQLPSSVKTDSMETLILQFVNEDRTAHGLSPLEMNSVETALAASHSIDMACGRVPFGHDGFMDRAKAIQDALKAVEIGENVAAGSMTAREVVNGWLNSPHHKKNIEGNYKLTGIALATDKNGDTYFTQIFSR